LARDYERICWNDRGSYFNPRPNEIIMCSTRYLSLESIDIQLCAGATPQERKKFSLDSPKDYQYLNQGGEPTIPNVNDADEFNLTRKALETIGLTSDIQGQIFAILAALLHIGNVQITATRNDALLSSTDEALVIASDLLGIDASSFAKWTTKKQITTRSEKIVSSLNQKQALVVRDSVAKFVYSSLFDWLVTIMNGSLATEEVSRAAKTFIGVLDIYGFEHFQKNSFEQFCINYANEKLQQEV
jgi:myosin-5